MMVATPAHRRGRRAVVLVAEDHDPTYRLIRQICEMDGIDVLRAMTRRAALALAVVGQPDLILMDYRLADGVSEPVARRLRRRRDTRRIPIVTMLPPGAGERRGAIPLGPLRIVELINLIRRRFSALSRPPRRPWRGRIPPRWRRSVPGPTAIPRGGPSG